MSRGRMTRGWKSGQKSVDRCELLSEEVVGLMPAITVRNRSVTTSSIYLKTPDGYSLRIGDHDGVEKYKYKWNLNPELPESKRGWKKEDNCWRFYAVSPEVLIAEINKSLLWQEAHAASSSLIPVTNSDLWERPIE